MAKNDTVVLVHPGGSKVELDAKNTSRIDALLARGYGEQKKTEQSSK